ncbi:MAG: TCR/Tet family transporter [Bacteroidetes bacterium]|jgi:DHA1 family tetracycline resistance protein-like MFS transporter|nr:TCR/Tet family transporter [Bacteroidota bacterium]
MSQTGSKKAILFIFITLLIDCIGIGIIIPVMPTLIQNLGHANISEASTIGGWLNVSYAIMQFIMSPILGGLSDKFGRRPVLLISLFGLGIDFIFLFLAPTLGWLFVGRIIAGICGASFTTASAYIADVSTKENRAQNFGMIGAAFGLGFIIGPALGSAFSSFGVRVPFLVAAVLSLINCMYGFFILPESLKKENRRNFEWKRANPIGSLLHLKKYPAILGLITSLIIIYIAGHAAQSTWMYITIEKFKWTEGINGLSISFVGLTIAIVQGGLIKVAMNKLGAKKSVYTGMIFYIIGFMLFAFANQGWMMFAFMIPYALGGIAGPAMQTIMSGQVPANAQGELQGAITSLMSLTSIVGPLLMTGLFAYFTDRANPVYFPGVPFFAGGILTAFSLLIAWIALRKQELK